MARHHHICIQTSCYADSLDFYTRILGFGILKETPDFHERDFNTWLIQEDMLIELQTPRRGEVLAPYDKNAHGIVHFCILVDDLERDYERMKSLGFTEFVVKNGGHIYKVENGNLLKIKAPEGTIIEIRDQYDL